MAFLPMAVYGLEVPAGDVAIPAVPDFPAAFNITMAAIDPSAEPEGDVKRATLKIIRQPLDMDDYSDEDDEDEDFDPAEMDAILAEGSDDDDDESEDDDEANGGPSDPKKTKAARKAAAQAALKKLLEQDDMDVDEAQTNGVNGKKSSKALGKMPASDEEDDDEDDDSEDGAEIEEFVICTLDPNGHYQQPLNLTIGEDERVFFKVSGSYSIHLTGNFIEPANDHHHGEDDDSEGEYDLSPDEDELDDEYDEESDDLDDMDDPRITEIEEEDEAPALVEAPKKAAAEAKKGKNKRAAEEDSSTLDAMITDSKAEPTADGEQKPSKKQLKKLKKNDGSAAAGAEKVEEPSSNKSDKKVQFAKNLEQGPTPTKATDSATPKTSLGIKTVQGVTLDDKKLGTGPAAKNGDRVGMRYIGKLASNNKVFDSNKKGKPFTFKLGKGEVIKGWDIGVAGMSVGQERRITIPPHHGYGSRGAPPDIPGNSTLVFDVKVVEINKGK